MPWRRSAASMAGSYMRERSPLHPGHEPCAPRAVAGVLAFVVVYVCEAAVAHLDGDFNEADRGRSMCQVQGALKPPLPPISVPIGKRWLRPSRFSWAS